jgi:hypothetical protein
VADKATCSEQVAPILFGNCTSGAAADPPYLGNARNARQALTLPRKAMPSNGSVTQWLERLPLCV